MVIIPAGCSEIGMGNIWKGNCQSLLFCLSKWLMRRDNLYHTNQWVETIDPSIITAQKSTPSMPDDTKTLFANYSSTSRQPMAQLSNSSTYQPRRGRSLHDSDWSFYYLIRPKYHNGRYWCYCTKCGRNGRWVCTHRDDTHKHHTEDVLLPIFDTRPKHPWAPSPSARHTPLFR